MALNDFLIKIDVPGIDCKGLYLKDTLGQFDKSKSIGKNELKKLDYEIIVIVVRLYQDDKQFKKTHTYDRMTGLQAVKKAFFYRQDLKAELEERGTLQKKKSESLNDVFLDYIDFKSKTLSKNNIYSTKLTYQKWIQGPIGEKKIDKVTTKDIQNIINHMIRMKMAPRTAQSIKQILRPVYKFAIDNFLCTDNPAIRTNIPSFDNTVNFELSDEKRKKLYEEIRKYEIDKYRGIMLFLFFGRRLNEVLTLKWENISFDKNIYTIEDKNNKIRKRQEYPLLEPLVNFLLEFSTSKYGFIFKGEKTPNVTAHTFRSHWKKVTKRAGIEKMRIHDTRHLLGNSLVNMGISLENIGSPLGHTSVAVTRRYSKTSLQTSDRVLNLYLEEITK